jgi:hypothetical protein
MIFLPIVALAVLFELAPAGLGRAPASRTVARLATEYQAAVKPPDEAR